MHFPILCFCNILDKIWSFFCQRTYVARLTLKISYIRLWFWSTCWKAIVFFFFENIFYKESSYKFQKVIFYLLFPKSLTTIAFVLIFILFIHWCSLLNIPSRDTLRSFKIMGNRPISVCNPGFNWTKKRRFVKKKKEFDHQKKKKRFGHL